MERYDAVVIGAGNGGLTASAALAQKGLKVLLLERHNIPGGCATSFCRGRFEFEVALHQLSGLGTPEKPGPLRMALGSLGVLDELEFVEMSDLYNVSMPDGFRVALRADRNETISELQEKFPHEKGAIERFFDLVYEYANQNHMHQDLLPPLINEIHMQKMHQLKVDQVLQTLQVQTYPLLC